MNITDLHTQQKEISAVPFFKGELTMSMQLEKNGTLKEHVTKTPALLLCISGHVIYHEENIPEIHLKQGDYVHIPPQVIHWLFAPEKSQCLLFK